MDKPFRRGLVAGILAPLFFLGAILLWIFRATRRVPFPVRRIEQGEVAIRLVSPEQVPALWQPWKLELEPLLAAFQVLGDRVKQIYLPRRP
jgi:hypothetical protein